MTRRLTCGYKRATTLAGHLVKYMVHLEQKKAVSCLKFHSRIKPMSNPAHLTSPSNYKFATMAVLLLPLNSKVTHTREAINYDRT